MIQNPQTPSPTQTPNRPSPAPNPNPDRANQALNRLYCDKIDPKDTDYYANIAKMTDGIHAFCSDFDYHVLIGNELQARAIEGVWLIEAVHPLGLIFGVLGKHHCASQILATQCEENLLRITHRCFGRTIILSGGSLVNNCQEWFVSPSLLTNGCSSSSEPFPVACV